MLLVDGFLVPGVPAMNARPFLLAVVAAGALASTGAFAARQTAYDPNRDVQVTESTDAQRIADIERHADELRARQQQGGGDQATTSGTSSARERASTRRARADRH
jgi:hypothetical protein